MLPTCLRRLDWALGVRLLPALVLVLLVTGPPLAISEYHAAILAHRPGWNAEFIKITAATGASGFVIAGLAAQSVDLPRIRVFALVGCLASAVGHALAGAAVHFDQRWLFFIGEGALATLGAAVVAAAARAHAAHWYAGSVAVPVVSDQPLPLPKDATTGFGVVGGVAGVSATVYAAAIACILYAKPSPEVPLFAVAVAQAVAVAAIPCIRVRNEQGGDSPHSNTSKVATPENLSNPTSFFNAPTTADNISTAPPNNASFSTAGPGHAPPRRLPHTASTSSADSHEPSTAQHLLQGHHQYGATDRQPPVASGGGNGGSNVPTYRQLVASASAATTVPRMLGQVNDAADECSQDESRASSVVGADGQQQQGRNSHAPYDVAAPDFTGGTPSVASDAEGRRSVTECRHVPLAAVEVLQQPRFFVLPALALFSLSPGFALASALSPIFLDVVGVSAFEAGLLAAGALVFFGVGRVATCFGAGRLGLKPWGAIVALAGTASYVLAPFAHGRGHNGIFGAAIAAAAWHFGAAVALIDIGSRALFPHSRTTTRRAHALTVAIGVAAAAAAGPVGFIYATRRDGDATRSYDVFFYSSAGASSVALGVVMLVRAIDVTQRPDGSRAASSPARSPTASSPLYNSANNNSGWFRDYRGAPTV